MIATRHQVVPALLLLAIVGACRAEEEVLDEVFSCDPMRDGKDCGTTQAGRPMMCFPARQLGGTDFCAERCDPKASTVSPAGYACMSSGALLRVCQPTASHQNPAVGCPKDLACYRTSLLGDQGVCVAMTVCENNSDCKDPTRPTCGSTLLDELTPAMPAIPLSTSSLQCIQTDCVTGSRACSEGESCIGAYYHYGPPIDDICVPSCDGNLHCPPNYSCVNDPVAAPGSPAICVPGIPGARCSSSRDCLVGDCVDVGVEFKVCTIPCLSNAQCAALNSKSDFFVCAGGPPGHCLTPRPFGGSNCLDANDCATGQQCFVYSPNQPVQHQGECRVPCDAGGQCPARGGLPHVCLGANGAGGCYPARFGLPCTGDSPCIASLACLDAAPDARSRSNYSAKICTLPCATDADCDASPLIGTGGFCQDGICRLDGWIGAPCVRDAQCSSGRCDDFSGTCAAPVSL